MKNFVIVVLLLVVAGLSYLIWMSEAVVQYPLIHVQDDVYIVEVVDDNLEDDSVRAVKYRLELMESDFGVWSIQDQSSSWICHEGRGHQEWNNELCI